MSDGAVKKGESSSHSFKARTSHSWDGEPSTASTMQLTCGTLLHSHTFEHLIGGIIFANFIVVWRETDIGASGEESPLWLVITGWVLLVIFVFELILKLFVLRSQFITDPWNIFDFLVISVDLVMGCIGLVEKDMIDVSALRILRLSRLARATKILRVFPELQLMVAGLAGAVQAIFWGTILILFAVLVWSILAVQFINDLNQEVADDPADLYAGCTRCRHAYDSVFHSAVTFTTQIVAGDSWGRETVPIIEKFPITMLFFAGVFLTIGLAILNLILGVVVNVATDARDGLQKQLESEKLMARSATTRSLLRMCRQMDKDGNDELNKEELIRGFEENEEFRETLQQLDIGREDLEIVWSVLDADHSGSITSKEFVQQVNTLKHTDVSYMLAYIKYYITDIKDRMNTNMQALTTQIDSDLCSLGKPSTVLSPERREVSICGRRSFEPRNSTIEDGMLSSDDVVASFHEEDVVTLKSIDVLLESALILAELQTTWQQMQVPIDHMQDKHMRLAKDLKAMAPVGEPVELLSSVQTIWNTGLTSIEKMRESHAQLADDLRNIAPIKEPSKLVPQLQDACQQCIISSGDMLSQHSELCYKIERMINRVNSSMRDCNTAPLPFK